MYKNNQIIHFTLLLTYTIWKLHKNKRYVQRTEGRYLQLIALHTSTYGATLMIMPQCINQERKIVKEND